MNRSLGPAVICCLIFSLILSRDAHAATFDVTRFDDIARGACDSGNDCSLREAIIATNESEGADLINLPAGSYGLTLVGTAEDDSKTGDLDVKESVEIVVTDGGRATIDANKLDRVFDILTSAKTVKLQDLVIQNGEVTPADEPSTECSPFSTGRRACGGGIKTAAESLELVRCTVTDNSARQGGGIYTVDHGSGLKTVQLTLRNSTVKSNAAVAGSGFQPNDGGGLYNGNRNGSPMIVVIENSTFSGNTAIDRHGGAIMNDASAENSSITITNSTLSGNRAGIAGAIDNEGRLTLVNSSLVGNVASGPGDAIENGYPGEPTTLTTMNSLIEGDCVTDPPVAPPTNGVNAKFQSLGGNLESPGDTCRLSQPSDHVGVRSTGTGPLQDNGGPTATHAVITDSDAINGGVPPCPATDQRGELRNDGTCDVGSYEVQGVPSVLTVTRLDDPSPTGCSPSDCSLREAVIAANQDPDVNIINIPSGTITLSLTGPDEEFAASGDLDIRAPVEIKGRGSFGPLASIITIQRGDRLFNPKGGGGSVKIEGVELRDGLALGDGGAISNFSNLTLEDVRVVNSETNGRGGGVFTGSGGSVQLIRSTVESTIASNAGGGLFSDTGTFTELEDSTIQSNHAGAAGGGIFVQDAPLVIDGSLVATNGFVATRATNEGGGIYVAGGEAMIRNSTFSGNVAAGAGQAIASTGELTLVHTTVANHPLGSAIKSTAAVQLRNTAVEGICDILVPPDDNGGTAVTSVSCAGLNARQESKLGLGPLAFNGGPTKTHAVEAWSPLVSTPCEKFYRDSCNDRDQAGATRDTLSCESDNGACTCVQQNCNSGALDNATLEQPTQPLRVGGTAALSGTRITAQTLLKVFLATSSGTIDVAPEGIPSTNRTESTWTGTLPWPWPVGGTTAASLGNGFVSLQLVQPDRNFTASNLTGAVLLGSASLTPLVPSIERISGHDLSETSSDLSIATANVETAIPRGTKIQIVGQGFVSPKVNVFSSAGNCGPIAPKAWSPTTVDFKVPGTCPIGPGSFQVVNGASPYRSSNAVSAPIGERISLSDVQVTGTTVTVDGTGFSSLTVINLFASSDGGIVNAGGLDGGSPKIPVTVVDSHRLTFKRPAGLSAGPAFLQAVNPPFIPYTNSGDDPDGSFMLP